MYHIIKLWDQAKLQINGFKVTYIIIICSNDGIKLSYKLMNLKLQEACLRWEKHAYTLVLLLIFALEQKFTKNDVEFVGIGLKLLKSSEWWESYQL